MLSIIVCSTVHAGVNFGSRDSTIYITSGALMNNGSNNLSINGTLRQDQGGAIFGNTINFDDGILHNDGLEALLDGQYDPTGSDIVRLQGNSRFRAEPGTLLPAITIQGTGNSIEGQPIFTSPIVLLDDQTEVAFAVQSRINQNIALNGGTVKLNDDLALQDEIKFIGQGYVDVNNQQLKLGANYSTPWGSDLYFNDASDVLLDCKITLTGIWTFGGGCLNGGGSILDLSQGGKIVVDTGSTLNIVNLFITGLGDGAGQILFKDDNGILRIANSTIKFDDNVTTTLGQVYVNGPTTLQLGLKNWTFNQNANLTVDGTTLWLDPLDSPCFTGGIIAPYPLYTNAGWSNSNLVADLAAGNLSLIRRGTIKEVVDTHMIDFTPGDCIINGDISGEIDLYNCICLGANDRINVVGDACINGHGVEVSFTDQPFSQLIVRPGVTLTLTNIKFKSINANSFYFQDTSAVQIGENVIWELETDMTFSTNATIRVLNGTDGCTPLSTGCNVFTIRGDHCRRAFHVQPLNDLLPNGQPNATFNLGHNTVLLESASLSGFDYISFFNDNECAAATALGCNAAADVFSNFPVVRGQYGTAMNFFVEGNNNELILRQDGLVLAGNISFGDLPDNELIVSFNLAEFLGSNDPARRNVMTDFPVVQFTGNPGVFLYSALGIAEMEFANYNAAVTNVNTNGFVVDTNSLLRFKRLQVLNAPIKQQSLNFRFEGIELFDFGIDPSFIRSYRSPSKYTLQTAIHKLRAQQKESFELALRMAEEKNPKSANSNNKKSKNSNRRERQQFRDAFEPSDSMMHDAHRASHAGSKKSDKQDDTQTRAIIVSTRDLNPETRALNLPGVFDQSYNYQVLNLTTAEVGSISYNGVTLNNFTVDPALAFNILIENGTVVTLGANVVLNNNHIINVRGKGNKIVLPYNMTIGQGNLNFDTDAELTIEFYADALPAAQFTIADNTTLVIEGDAVLRFSGPGYANLGNNVVLNCNGTKTVNMVTKAETISSRAVINIVDAARVRMNNGAFARVIGVGEIRVAQRGQLYFDKAGTLAFGLDTSALDTSNCSSVPADYFNDILFNVYDNGEVVLAPTTGNQQARVSFRYVASTINFVSGGLLFVDANGLFEVNADQQSPRPSFLKSLSFKDGALAIFSSGIFSLGSNRLNLGAGTSIAATGLPFTFPYDGRVATIEGDGSVRYVNPTAGFTSALSPATTAFTLVPQESSQQLINALASL